MSEDYTIRFYAACLASYNNGVLHGVWIDASDDIDEMEEKVATMLRDSKFPNVTVEHPETGEPVPSAEEWAMHDSEGLPNGLGEYCGLKPIAEWMEVIKEAEDRNLSLGLVQAVANNFGEPHNGEFSSTLEAIRDGYRGAHNTLADYAESFIEKCDMLNGVPDTLARYFDFAAYGRDMELGGDIFTIRHEGELHVFDNN